MQRAVGFSQEFDPTEFISSQQYLFHLIYVDSNTSPPPLEPWGQLGSPYTIATDQEDNVYVLADTLELRNGRTVRSGGLSVTVNDHHQVFVVVDRDDGHQVEVYETRGLFVRTFEAELLGYCADITAANDGQVTVLDVTSQCVHVFSAQGDHLCQFKFQGKGGQVAFAQASEHVIISSLMIYCGI